VETGSVRRPWTRRRFVGGVRKYGLAAFIDAGAVLLTYLIAVALRTGGRLEQIDVNDPTQIVAFAALTGSAQVFGNIIFDVYWRDWGAASLEDAIAVAKATLFSAFVLVVVSEVTAMRPIPLGAIAAGASFAFVVEVALRLRVRWPQILRAAFGQGQEGERLIVVGAGGVGRLLAADVAYSPGQRRIACFVDDDPKKYGSYVRGVRVDGGVEDLPRLIAQYRPSVVVIAAASPTGELIRRVIAACDGTEVRVRRVGGLSLVGGDTSTLREIAIEELLARDPVHLDTPEARDYLRGRTVLVTGAAGSIGSELSIQLARFGPARLVLLDTNESGLHAITSRVQSAELLLADIRDRPTLRYHFESVRPHIVFHAAAYKHVPILERAPLAGIVTNVLGTANVIECSASVDAERLVFISSDKAVEPTSVLGYTKRFGELLTLSAARSLERSYVAVRFGNVLGSSGSVVPIFTRQIDNGGPVTVTDRRATRYFMTIEEAAGLVIEAAAVALPGQLMVLDMGEPVSILELAERMIRLRGLRVGADVRVEIVGLRPGEKMHEQLLFPTETAVATRHPGVKRATWDVTLPTYDELRGVVQEIERLAADQDATSAIELIRNAIASKHETEVSAD
jgi:FlaA1/EpsC-like NDP-sugar epimerase